MNELFVPMRCCKTGRSMMGCFSRRSDGWYLTRMVLTGSGPQEASAQRKGGRWRRRRNEVTGKIGVADEFMGCPDCGNQAITRCGQCEQLTCYYGQFDALCAHCGRVLPVSGRIGSISPSDSR